MKKLFKRITAVFMAAIMMATVLCTNAFAAGIIRISHSGNAGNYTVKYEYSADNDGARTQITTSSYATYSISFTPVSGTSACIYFRNVATGKYEKVITPPQVVSGGMPGSFTTIIDLQPNTKYEIKFASASKTVIANGSCTIPHIAKHD